MAVAAVVGLRTADRRIASSLLFTLIGRKQLQPHHRTSSFIRNGIHQSLASSSRQQTCRSLLHTQSITMKDRVQALPERYFKPSERSLEKPFSF